MKAAIFREANRHMAIEEVAISAPGPHEVLVKLKAVGVCHSDLHVLDGSLPHPTPAILGHEAAGVVEAVGFDVRGVKAGDHVVVLLTFHCGHCEQCEGGNSHRCMPAEAQRNVDEPPRMTVNGEGLAQFCNVGAFAEKILVHDSGCVPIRKDMPLDRACLIGCGVTTGFGAVTRAAGVRPGETVAVIGTGGVGLAAINGAVVAGAGRIIAIDRLPSKLALAIQFGATDTVDASAVGDVVAEVMAVTGGRGVDHSIECIGLKQTIEQAYNMLARGGTATVVGVGKPDTTVEVNAISLLREKKLQGSLMGGVRNLTDVPRFVELYMQGRLKLDELISKRRPLSELNEAFDDLKAGSVARSVIMFDD